MNFTPQVLKTDDLKAHIGELFQNYSASCKVIRVRKHLQVYTVGVRDESVYLIERGYLKLLRPASEGNEYPVAIYGKGDLFGESSLSGQMIRSETAVAMSDCRILKIPSDAFLASLGSNGPLISMTKYLASRLTHHRQAITSLLASNKAHELSLTLLLLCREMGTSDPCGARIDERICQRKLAVLTGTGRSRISVFLKRLERLGFISRSNGRCLVIEGKKLQGYLTLTACGEKLGSDRVH
ncbi:MAG TPA: Crp/Fnr family transcriptional regulator [Acidobacteriota bacterium]|nr:Crp/Fnr family transcriptional regulator [Acidobacteriota bacterium]